jgi:subtilisin family serine protease
VRRSTRIPAGCSRCRFRRSKTSPVAGFTLGGYIFALMVWAVLSTPLWGARGAHRAVSSKNIHKLINPQDIVSGLEDSQSTVPVIVSLFEPNEVKQEELWSKPKSRGALRAKIRARQMEALSALGGGEFRLRHTFENLAGFSGEITAEGLNRLLDEPTVKSIQPDYIEQIHLAQGIPLIKGMTYRSIYDGTGVAIAIVDTGIDYTHPRLGGGGFPNSKVIGGYDCGDGDSDPMPNTQAHGTCCAGIAAGDLGTTGDYIGGVAPGAKLYALKVTSGIGSGANMGDIIAAWDWCISHQYSDPNNPILVISLSMGSGGYFSPCDSNETAYADAADRVHAVGITILSSSGNDGYCDSIARPACVSNIISVGAVYDADFGTYQVCVSAESCAPKHHGGGCSTGWYATDDAAPDMVTSYSNTASFLDLLAPSNNAYTTDIAGPDGYSGTDYEDAFGGTSAACPYAAGAVACLQSAAKAVDGNYLSPDEVRDILTLTGDLVTDGKVAITKPRVNLEQAIETFALPPPCCTTTITSFPYSENFEGEALCGTTCGDACPLTGDWTNELGDDQDWTVNSGPTDSSYTGPDTDHNPGTSAGKYLYTEASSCFNSEAILTGPCFDLNSVAIPQFRFWYHMYGSAMGSLTVEVSDSNCTGWTAVWTLSGDQGNSWHEAVVDFSAYSGSMIKVRFRGITGSDYTSDMAIDDVKLIDAAVVHYTLTVSSGAGGSATEPGEGSFLYTDGTVVDINAAPNDGYYFVNWTGDTATIADVNAAATTIIVDANYSIQANFALNPYAPVIASTPVTTATATDYYAYDVDADGIPEPTYSLITSPNDMTIDVNTGLLEWMPDYFDIGPNNPVTVQATNSQGYQQQNFQIGVLPGDDFETGVRSAMWQRACDNYQQVKIVEDGNRLAVLAPEANNVAAAVYAANGWALDTNESFAVEVEFGYLPDANVPGWVGFTIEDEQDYVSISAGADGNESRYYYETVVDGNLIAETETRDDNEGAFYIWYDADSNCIYVSSTGFGAEDAYLWRTTGNPLQWNRTTPVSIVLGGGSNGGVFESGEVYLDNFKVVAGRLYNWPPVTDLNEDGFIEPGDIAAFAEHWLTDPNAPPDFDNNGTVDFLDFAELGLAW